MNSRPHATDHPIQTTGLWLFGGLSFILVLGKLIGLWGGSWWRMALPIWVLVAFKGFYIGMGFLYLTLQPVRERAEEEERALLSGYRDGFSYGSGFVFVVGLVMNLISRLEGAEAVDGWWLFSGRVAVMVVFGVFSAISLWLYWSGIGHVLRPEEDEDNLC